MGITNRQREELQALTEELPQQEQMLRGLNAAIAAAGADYAKVESLMAEQEAVQAKVDAMTERWCELEDLMEQADGE